MARSDRLIKLNRANESRANLAWGMQWIHARRFATLVGTTRTEKPESLSLSLYLSLSSVVAIVGNHGERDRLWERVVLRI